MTTVLFVCTANVCRSPAAAELWLRVAKRSGQPAKALSAGVQARAGQAAHPVMVELLAGYGCNLTDHASRQFSARLARQADLILVMESVHQRSVVSFAPEMAGRVMLLGHWGEGPVHDPVGRSRADYVDCLEHMECAMESWLEHLQQRSAPRVAYA
jgi:protein-tyrosine phosphatase